MQVGLHKWIGQIRIEMVSLVSQANQVGQMGRISRLGQAGLTCQMGQNGLIQSVKLIKPSERTGYSNQASGSADLVNSSNWIGQTMLVEQVD